MSRFIRNMLTCLAGGAMFIYYNVRRGAGRSVDAHICSGCKADVHLLHQPSDEPGAPSSTVATGGEWRTTAATLANTRYSGLKRINTSS